MGDPDNKHTAFLRFALSTDKDEKVMQRAVEHVASCSVCQQRLMRVVVMFEELGILPKRTRPNE